MRITGRLLRQLIREELDLQSGGISILPAGVSPDLVVGFWRRWYGTDLGAPAPGLADRIVSQYGLDPQPAEELAQLAYACFDPNGEKFPFSDLEVTDHIGRALGFHTSSKKLSLETKMQSIIDEHFGIKHNFAVDAIYLITNRAERTGRVDRARLDRALRYMKGIDPDMLQGRVDFMDTMYKFAERKRIPKDMQQKLLALCLESVPGMMQAAELYSML